MASARFKVLGLRQLDHALAELPKATGKNALRQSARKGGEPIARDMKALAPDDPDTGGKDLRNSIGVSTKLSRRQAQQNRGADRATVEVFVGSGPLPQAHMTEFGSINNSPVGWARSSWDANKMKSLKIITAELGVRIEKARQRLAKKALR